MALAVPTLRAALSTAGCLVVVLTAPSAEAQQAAKRDAGPILATREQLRSGLARLQREAGSATWAALIRSRLDSGDFQVGDHIVLQVEGEQPLSGTFTVAPGPELMLPQLGAVPLGGVLRSELQGRLAGYLARYIQNPVVQVQPLIRVLIEGGVARPGFYTVPPELPLPDVFTVAGGLTAQARVTGVRVDRRHEAIWDGELLQQAL